MIRPSGQGLGNVRILLFDSHWHYLRSTYASHDGRFELKGVAPGAYKLQVMDKRPRYATHTWATANSSIRVSSDHTTAKYVTMRPGAVVGGVVTGGGHTIKYARVVAADSTGASYRVKANRNGQFAIGGLPTGRYSFYAWDLPGRYWSGKPLWVGRIKRGTRHWNTRINLGVRAGGLNGFVFSGGNLVTHKLWVTAVSRRTGQWWVFKVVGGAYEVRGMLPGRYRFTVTGGAVGVGRVAKPRQRVHSGRIGHLDLHLGSGSMRPTG